MDCKKYCLIMFDARERPYCRSFYTQQTTVSYRTVHNVIGGVSDATVLPGIYFDTYFLKLIGARVLQELELSYRLPNPFFAQHQKKNLEPSRVIYSESAENSKDPESRRQDRRTVIDADQN
jgi:hypothetical protein